MSLFNGFSLAWDRLRSPPELPPPLPISLYGSTASYGFCILLDRSVRSSTSRCRWLWSWLYRPMKYPMMTPTMIETMTLKTTVNTTAMLTDDELASSTTGHCGSEINITDFQRPTKLRHFNDNNNNNGDKSTQRLFLDRNIGLNKTFSPWFSPWKVKTDTDIEHFAPGIQNPH